MSNAPYYDKRTVSLEQYANSIGRYSRKGYIIETIILFILLTIVVYALDKFWDIENQQVLLLVFVAPAILEHIRSSKERWHDLWIHGIAVISQILLIPYLFLFVKRWTVGLNKYGTDPLFEKNNRIAKRWKCPKCKNQLANITEQKRKYIMCPLKHGFLNKNKDWIGEGFIYYIMQVYADYIWKSKSEVPKDIQDIWIMYHLFQSEKEIKWATTFKPTKEEIKEIKKEEKEEKRIANFKHKDDEEKAGSEWD